MMKDACSIWIIVVYDVDFILSQIWMQPQIIGIIFREVHLGKVSIYSCHQRRIKDFCAPGLISGVRPLLVYCVHIGNLDKFVF